MYQITHALPVDFSWSFNALKNVSYTTLKSGKKHLTVHHLVEFIEMTAGKKPNYTVNLKGMNCWLFLM